ncbi:hypothetical protein PR003_g2930 [Phytophthora rubi]|uniref:Uncharacterized protein n=1 Tax=Phytophthora rubi TaxID=129364 RepID=A0A6A3P6H2_9STRA|nr:hypothetical protein PR002_g551 [Phytophthora rubi]KAE9052484.1 hypothetical protein PR001_g462 [Phytophthora rubi]KAE9355258.1 hypothetical protein PR003_g2930 [Phytophthora rubi]
MRVGPGVQPKWKSAGCGIQGKIRRRKDGEEIAQPVLGKRQRSGKMKTEASSESIGAEVDMELATLYVIMGPPTNVNPDLTPVTTEASVIAKCHERRCKGEGAAADPGWCEVADGEERRPDNGKQRAQWQQCTEASLPKCASDETNASRCCEW